MKNLVVVESPAKVKTISKYLGDDYIVKASYGHLVDLPKKELGVDTEKSFEPKYVVTKRKRLSALKKAFEDADTLIIASDPDREGEAIGWHVAQKLGVITKRGSIKKGKEMKRIEFNSITKDAVKKALDTPRTIDMNLVDAQQARRILDRLVGYKLSPLIWKKIRYGLSAGRVQSVAVRLVVEREEERDKFNPEEYWNLYADVADKSKSKVNIKINLSDEERFKDFDAIKFELKKYKGKTISLDKQKEVDTIIEKIKNEDWIVKSTKTTTSKRNPKSPFITSTLQRVASNRFGYSAKKTMSIAQKLYEAGLITYMRTDSVNIVPDEAKKIRDYVSKKYGEEYVQTKGKKFKTSDKAAQEAHEAIRPTNPKKTAKDLGLDGQKAKLYELIWSRALASQMKPAKIENDKININVNGYLFQARGQRLVFDGYLKVYKERFSENVLPQIKEGQKLFLDKLIGEQSFTKPPARYSEATLIKALESHGIGRPSTYAPTISTIISRKYVVKDGKYLIPTDTGKVVDRLLTKYFEEIVDYGFTAEMEEDLDKIAEGKVDYKKIVKDFYKPFEKKIEKGEEKIKKDEFTVLGDAPDDMKCPECGSKMVIKLSRYGKFYSCSKFPDCQGMRDLEGKTEEDKANELAKKAKSKEFKEKYQAPPKAEDGRDYLLKEGKYGEFWAHPDYPKKKDAQPLQLKPEKQKEIYGEPPKTDDGRDYLLKSGRYGKFWSHPDYPKVKDIKKVKKQK